MWRHIMEKRVLKMQKKYSNVYQGVFQAMLKDKISWTVREISADMLLSAVLNTVLKMQYVVQKQ